MTPLPASPVYVAVQHEMNYRVNPSLFKPFDEKMLQCSKKTSKFLKVLQKIHQFGIFEAVRLDSL